MSDLCRTDFAVNYGDAVGGVLAFGILSGLWLRMLDGVLQPGFLRAFAVLPVVAGNLIAPKLFCRGLDAITVILVAFNTMWLCSFKACAWALNRGPLATARLTWTQFVATYVAPLTPKLDGGSGGEKGRLGESAGGAGAMLRKWVAKMALIGGVVALLVAQPSMPGMLRTVLMTFGLYGLLSSIMDGPAVLLTGLLGMELSPHFDSPWLSHSVSSFWNKRWDLAAGNTLRTTVFDPIVEGRLVFDPRVATARNVPSRQLVGTCAAFLVSGLVHELIYWYMMGTHTGGLWLAYFTAQAPLVVGERLLLAAMKRHGLVAPTWARIAATLGVSCVVAHLLFWPVVVGPCLEQVVANLMDCFAAGSSLAEATVRATWR